MQVGDLVKASRLNGTMLGVIVAKVDEPRALHNDVFRVLWTDGGVREYWDYDLEKVGA